MDYIELALSRYTDFTKFERLSLEVMSYYGFGRIKKVGGYNDDGVDAVSSDVYVDETQHKRIFQFTMQKDLKAKIKDTVNKLNKNSIDYDELIIVTSQVVNSIDGLSKQFRIDNRKNLQIYDLSTFVLVISKNKDIFHRYFPDIRTQMENDFFKENYFSESGEDKLSISMIKSTLLFSLSPDLNTNLQRKDLFDKTTLSFVSLSEVGLSVVEMLNEFRVKFNKILPESQIIASLERLINRKLLIKENDKYVPSKKAKTEMMLGVSHIEHRTEAFISDIIACTHDVASEIKCSIEDNNIMRINLKKTLNLFFKYYGTDLALGIDFIDSNMVRQEELVKLLKSGISDELGECLVYSLGQILSNPSEEQLEVVSLWAKAFIGTQLMRLDPMLSEFQHNTFKDKIFILDTDFVLNCIVKNGKQSNIYSKLLSKLLEIGCNVYITPSVVDEIISHAEFAERNYNYFKNTFNTVDELIIYEKLSNIFVIDYYIELLNKNGDFSEDSFKSYISNVYDSGDPYNFMLEVLEHRLPKGIIIGELEGVDLDVVEKEDLANLIYNETIKTPKAAYRTDDENMKIAKTDAELYLIARSLNKQVPVDNKKMLMYGVAYLITNSTRSIRCAKSYGIFSAVVTKPSILVALLSEIGWFDAPKKSIVDLLGNPFLAEIVNQNWDDVKFLVDFGVDLKGKELPRLRRDLHKVMHELIIKDEKKLGIEEDKIGLENVNNLGEDSIDEFILCTEKIKNKGYKMIPAVDKMIEFYEKMKKEKENQEKINNEIQLELKKIGKGKQAYIKRIAEKNKK